MIERIRAAFIEMIKSKTWIDDKTKALCVQKAEKMSTKILFPPAVLNDTLIDNYYKPVQILENLFPMGAKYWENRV